MRKKVILISNTDGALYKFRRALLVKLRELGVNTVAIASPHSPEGSYLSRLRAVCDVLYSVDFFRQGWLSLFLSPIRIARICREERADVVHIYGHEAFFFSIPALLICRPTRGILTITGLGRFFLPDASRPQVLIRLFILLVYFFSLRFLDRVIFLNESDKATFERYFGIFSSKFVLISGEGSDFPLAGAYNARPAASEIHFLFASRVMAEKGVVELLQAFVRLPSNFILTVAGTIDDSVKAHPFVASMINGEIKNVRYVGFVQDVVRLIDGSDCVVLPTKYMEGLPIFLVEALSRGRFILTSKAPGCSDVVVDGVNGFLLDEVSPSAICEYVLKIPGVDLVRAHAVSKDLFLKKFDARIVVRLVLQEYSL